MTSSTSSSWHLAFARAKTTEAEGRAAFADVLDDPRSAFASRKNKRLANAEAEGEDEEGDEEEEEAKAKRGCFRQPRGLSQLYRRLADSLPPEPEAPELPAPEAAPKESNLARQICRQWLKARYLSHPVPCDGTCGRLHSAPPGNLNKLYKDYSFKGLPKNDRNKIIAQMQAEREGDHLDAKRGAPSVPP